MQAQVAEFHDALEVTARQIPTRLPENERRLRATLILEEAFETIEALGFGFGGLTNGKPSVLPRFMPEHPIEQIKEISDLLYVTFGTAVTMGVDLEPFFTAVHENNMTKAGGEIREDGKRMKPIHYQPVNLRPVLNDYLKTICATCRDYGEAGPPHFASERCESGQYNHCSCDNCF